ncbi:MAG: hypothetical protein RIC89_02015, partial [Pseudomonadales bacterium]
TNEAGLLFGAAVSFILVILTYLFTDVAWPWYCIIGGVPSIVLGWASSFLFQSGKADNGHEHHPYSIPGLRAKMLAGSEPTSQDGWSLLPGKIDRASYGMIVFFFLSVGAVLLLDHLAASQGAR